MQPLNLINNIATFSDGYPRIALLLADSYKNDPTSLTRDSGARNLDEETDSRMGIH